MIEVTRLTNMQPPSLQEREEQLVPEEKGVRYSLLLDVLEQKSKSSILKYTGRGYIMYKQSACKMWGLILTYSQQYSNTAQQWVVFQQAPRPGSARQ